MNTLKFVWQLCGNFLTIYAILTYICYKSNDKKRGELTPPSLLDKLLYRGCGAERDRTADLLNAIQGVRTDIVELTGITCQKRDNFI